MIRSFYFLLFYVLCTLPLICYSADTKRQNETKIHLITKGKLKCLYEEIDNLLSEPADPVIVLLKSPCTQLLQKLPSEEKGRLPLPKPKVDENPTLEPADVLVLTHSQLICFKSVFDSFMQQTEDMVPVRFTETCIATDKIKP